MGTTVPDRRCVLAALIVFFAACSQPTDRPLQGYIEGEYIRVGPQFAGILQQLSVQRGDQVAAGAPLFALERENEVAARRQAEEQLRAALARLDNLKTGKRAPEVETVAEQLRQAQAARELSAANFKRQESLFKSGFISQAALDDMRTKLKSDDALVAQLRAAGGRPSHKATGGCRSARRLHRRPGASTTRTMSSATSCPPAAPW